MSFHRTTTAVLALIAAGPALAQDSALTADGEIGVYYLHSDGDGDTFLFGDADLSYSFGNFGVELSLIGFAVNSDANHAVFGGGSFTFGNGMKFVLGAPRSAFDRYEKPGFTRANKLYAYAPFISGTSLLTLEELGGSLDDIGVAFSMGDQSNIGFDASYHRVDDGDADVFALGGSYAAGASRFEGAFELIDTSSSSISQLKLAGHWQLGLLDAGAYFSYVSEGSADQTFAELNGDYELTDRINLGGSYGHLFGSGPDGSVVSAYGAYEVFDGANASLGILKAEGSDPVYQLGVGLKF